MYRDLTTTPTQSSPVPRMGTTTPPWYRGMLRVCLLMYLLSVVSAVPPDKICESCHHRLKRSVDLNEAHSLSNEYRLPGSVIPNHYTLYLEPYMEDAVYSGRVSINVTILEEVEEIQLHCAHAVYVSAVELFVGKHMSTLEKVSIENWTYDPRKPILTVRLNDTMPEGYVGTMHLNFNSTMETRTSTAFFKNFYTTGKDNAEQTWPVAAFQLRPTNARRVFPCFDEPALKATFDFSVVQPKSTKLFGNTIAIKEEDILDEPNAQRVYFKRTPPISTFALGLVIGNFSQCNGTIRYIHDKRNRVDIRVWAREELFPALRTLNDKLEEIFTQLDTYWGVPLPLTSLDIIAVPEYQGPKPADSFGLIIFKEADLANNNYLQLAQEIGYQWSGILATPAWWSELHFNKALTNYVAADIAFMVNDGGDAEGKWPMTVLYSLYYEFSKRYPHSKITGMKQETASNKIELILRMLNYTLSPNVLKKSLQTFMNDSQLKTFTAEKLWSTINEVNSQIGHAKIDVRAVVKSWISKDRVPFITATREDENNDLHVFQNAFREHPLDFAEFDPMLWWIPLKICHQDEIPTNGDELLVTGTDAIWMEPKRGMIIPNMPSRDKFIIVNPEEIGPFMVNYDGENWELLASYLQNKQTHNRIPVLTRAKLLHDAWNLAFATQLSFKYALDMTLFLHNERHHLVWEPFFTLVDRLSRRICPSLREQFNRHVLNVTYELRNRYGPQKTWTYGEGVPTWLYNHRNVVQAFLCRSNYPPCTEGSIYYFNLWISCKDGSSVVDNPFITHPAMLAIGNSYVCPALEHGTVEMYQQAVHRLLTHTWRKKSDRTFLLKALAGCARNTTKLHTLLNMTVMSRHENVSETDQHLIFSIAANTVDGTEALFTYLRANFDALRAKFIKNTNLWDNIINSATAFLSTKENLKDLQEFYTSHKGEFASADHIIEGNIKKVREQAAWTDWNMPLIRDWLNRHVDMNATISS